MIKPFLLNISFLILLILLGGCSSVNNIQEQKFEGGRLFEDVLTYDQAHSRKQRISNVHYNLYFDLSSAKENFSGTAKLSFELSDNTENLTIDFGKGNISRLILNGRTITTGYKRHFLTLPNQLLKVGYNEVIVHYTLNYSNEGLGLHRYKDPTDDEIYLYSYLWPYYANRLFPSFDQPNLKASFQLSVDAPSRWQVVSTTKGLKTEKSKKISNWKFETTPIISTYAFSLHAGPYQVWEDTYKGIPLRLLARQSQKDYVRVKEWFDVTKKGMAYFEKYFDIPYQFKKYDQLIIQQTTGAMESIAAVTFSESYVQRDESSYFERKSRASVILHELAHMWFGNLVTKDWWNDFWLNESFATFMASIAMADTTEFKDVWHEFYLDNKLRAYMADTRVSTHPVESPVHNTNDIYLIFDDITYEKGASVLRQLQYFNGEENYQLAVSNYLKKYAWSNTTLTNFIREQALTSNKNLDAWANQWLRESGVNILSPEIKCENNKISSLIIKQSFDEAHPVHRDHKTKVALIYKNNSGKLAVEKQLSVSIKNKTTEITEAVGLNCPLLVYPNFMDYGYTKVKFDNPTLLHLKNHINDFPDPLLRSMLWQVFIDLSEQGEYPIDQLILEIIESAHNEKNILVLNQLSITVAKLYDYLLRKLTINDSGFRKIESLLIDKIWSQTLDSNHGNDIQEKWFKLYLKLASGGQIDHTLKKLLRGEVVIPGLILTKTRRWEIIQALALNNNKVAMFYINEELQKDNSERAFEMALTARVSLKDRKNKQYWFSKLNKVDSDYDLKTYQNIMSSLYPNSQLQFQRENFDKILSSIPPLSKRQSDYFVSSYIANLLKPLCDEETSEKLSEFIHNTPQLSKVLIRNLREAHQANEECVGVKVSVGL